MNLVELQRRMVQDVTRPLTPEFTMQSEPAGGQTTETLAESYVKPNDRLTSFERLEIYNRQYWFRVIASVGEDYPALNAILGQKRFDSLVLAYLRENPSTSYSLRNLGAQLPQWLAAHPEHAPRKYKLALEVARLEWAYIEAFDSAEVAPLQAADLHQLGPASALYLQPHVQLLALLYPVDELVLAVHQQTPEADITSNAVSQRKQAQRVHLPPMRRSAVYLVVHRYQDSVYYRRIDREAFLLLSAFKQGCPLGQAIERALEGSKLSPEEQASNIREYFAHASELGWLSKDPPAQTASDA